MTTPQGSNVSPKDETTSVFRTIGRAISTGLIDTMTAVACAVILWQNGGTTVVNGATFGILACLIVATIGLTVRAHLSNPTHVGRDQDAPTFITSEVITTSFQGAVLASGLMLWWMTHSYFWGWLVCLAGIFSTVGGLWQMLATVLNTRNDQHQKSSTAHTRGQAIPSALTHLLGTACGLAVIVLTAPIHTWNVSIISTMILLFTGAILISAAANRHIRSRVGKAT